MSGGGRPTGRVLLAAVLLGLLVLDATAGSLLAAQRAGRQERLDEQLLPARDEVTALLRAYVDQETGVRGFVVTGSEEFLEPYDAGRRDQVRLAGSLQQRLENDAELSARLRDVVRNGEDWTRNAAEPEIASRRAGDVATATSLVTSRTGKVRFDRLRASVAALQEDLNAEVDRVNEQTRRFADAANAVVVGSAVLALLLAAALAAQVQRRVLAPLRRLRHAAEAAARNPRRGPLELSGGDADVRAIASSAEVLRQATVRHGDSAARAQDALAQEAPTVAAISNELSPTIGSLPGGLLCGGRTVPAEGDVAGDVYDVLALESGQVALLVADAAGHGPQAGLVALRAKHILVGGLRRGLGPADALTRLSVELGDTGEGFLTVFVATVDLPGGALRYASAGHPAGVLLHAGAAEPLPATGPLLGPVQGAWTTAEATLPPHATLAVFTDGIPDARASDGQPYGWRRLIELLTAATATAARSGAPLDAQATVESVFADLDASAVPRGGSTRPDDRTLVLLHRPPRRAEHGRWVPLPAEAASAGAARRLLRDELTAVPDPEGSDDLADAAQLCLTELVTNAVLHGGGNPIAVAVTARNGIVHVAVRDDSAIHPHVLVHSASSSTGRGLALVAGFSSQWGSEPLPDGGKVVWCELSVASARRGATHNADPWLAELGELLDPAPAGTGPEAPDSRGREVRLLRYPVRRGVRAREYYRSVLRDCQLRALPAPPDNAAASTTGAAQLLAEVYTGHLQAEHRDGSDLTAAQNELLAAFSRGDRAVDLTMPAGEQANELLAAVQAAVAEVRLATSAGNLLAEAAPPEIVELDDWTIRECVRQLAGEPPAPWAGPLD